MNKDIVLGLVRHVITAGGGLVIGKGYIDASAFDAAVGAIVTLIGIGWSVVDKRSR